MNDAPPYTLTQRRRRYSNMLTDATGWLDMAKLEARRGNYWESTRMLLCACSALDQAMSYGVVEDIADD